MKIDALKQYAKLRQQLLEEKAGLEARLTELNQVIGSEIAPAPPASITAATETSAPVVQPRKRGRPPGGKMSMREAITHALSERGPLSRGELGQAVMDLGYRSHAKNPLGSMGVLLYAKNSPFKKKDGKFYLPGGAQVPAVQDNDNGQAEPPAMKRKYRRSAEARARMAEAQRASWARRRQGK
jgi:hypothetical protein